MHSMFIMSGSEQSRIFMFMEWSNCWIKADSINLYRVNKKGQAASDTA